VPTYDLRQAKYDSRYIAFTSKEVRDHNFKPLQPLAPFEQDYINRFDPGGGWPFMVINGQYAGLGPGFSPGIIQGQNFDSVRQEVTSGAQTPGAQAILREADVITRYICASTGDAPANACKP
jgi:hypothetical protein